MLYVDEIDVLQLAATAYNRVYNSGIVRVLAEHEVITQMRMSDCRLLFKDLEEALEIYDSTKTDSVRS